MPLALGIDFEHIRHTPAYRGLENADGVDVDLSAATSELLDLFDAYDVTATFFVVSQLAETHPETIREIDRRGHEIASHTRFHRSLVNLDDDDLPMAIQGSKADLESVVDHPIRGFRAPTCQIDQRAYHHLTNAGYEYSSSVMPSIPIPGFYESNGGPRTPTQLTIPEGSIYEFPVAVAPGVRLPVSGAWMRLLGRRYTLTVLRRLAQTGVACTYSHPWEFQSMAQPLPFRCRYRTGRWMRKTYEKLLDLDCEFVTYSTLCERSESLISDSTDQVTS